MVLRRLLLACLPLLLALPLSVVGQTYMNFTVQQPAPPAAGFIYTQNNLTFDYVDQSAGNVVQWQWDFGNGNTSALQNPQFTFAGGGTFIVCLTAIDDNNCSSTICDTIVAVGVLPSQLQGLTLQPNPFVGTTSLQYELDHAALVRIGIYSLQGSLVEEVVDEPQFAGAHTYQIGAKLAQGSYFVRVDVDDQTAARKLIKVN